MQRYEIYQGGHFLGSLKAESTEAAIAKGAEVYADEIEALDLDSAPPLTAELLMPRVELRWQDYLVELQGENAKVWVKYEGPHIDGPIDGIEDKYPDLWAHLLEIQAIKEVA